jgi:hypothetical protein
VVSKSYRTNDAIVHFSSRSLIVEIKDNNQPLYKYLLRNMAKEPSFDQSYQKGDKASLPMIAYAKRIVEVPINSMAPKPYVRHEATKTLEGTDCFELAINIEFHSINEFFNALREMYILYQQKGNSLEESLDAIIFQHYDFARQVRNCVFDTTRVKKLSEKKLMP